MAVIQCSQHSFKRFSLSLSLSVFYLCFLSDSVFLCLNNFSFSSLLFIHLFSNTRTVSAIFLGHVLAFSLAECAGIPLRRHRFVNNLSPLVSKTQAKFNRSHRWRWCSRRRSRSASAWWKRRWNVNPRFSSSLHLINQCRYLVFALDFCFAFWWFGTSAA